ncbi:Uncharacterized protein Rs2_15838 [Raphanus sativus]|nr:Uncharacterized protein Rs2_15838 [Raphanus sativus]
MTVVWPPGAQDVGLVSRHPEPGRRSGRRLPRRRSGRPAPGRQSGPLHPEPGRRSGHPAPRTSVWPPGAQGWDIGLAARRLAPRTSVWPPGAQDYVVVNLVSFVKSQRKLRLRKNESHFDLDSRENKVSLSLGELGRLSSSHGELFLENGLLNRLDILICE